MANLRSAPRVTDDSGRTINKPQVNIRLTPDIISELRQWAAREHRTMSFLVTTIIEQALLEHRRVTPSGPQAASTGQAGG